MQIQIVLAMCHDDEDVHDEENFQQWSQMEIIINSCH